MPEWSDLLYLFTDVSVTCPHKLVHVQQQDHISETRGGPVFGG